MSLPARMLCWLPVQGLKDLESKRKAIGSGFIDVFREFAEKLKSSVGVQPRFLVQVCQQIASRP